ncbi:MAG TPA: class I SAM-dependent methyltransferase [Patescibacteria group bacterium]|nr:class I SAM-dependent methyltransferase [Patescibacteria group bacterium]
MNSDEKRWNEINKRLSGESIKHSYYAQLSEPKFSRGSKICELGGGLGYDALFFLENGHNVVLLDISKFALSQAKSLVKSRGLDQKLLTITADFGVGMLPLKENSFDIVYSRIGLNYFPTDETRKLFSEIYRVLHREGRAYLALKSPDDIEEMKFLTTNCVELEENVFIEGEQIRSRFDKSQITKMLEDIGISDYDVNSIVERKENLRDEADIFTTKPLFLNEVTFGKI